MRLVRLLAASLLLSSPAVAGLPDGIDEQSIRRAAVAIFPDYFDLLRRPSVALHPEDLRRNADWLVQALEKRGFAAKQIGKPDKPLVFARYGGNSGNRPTILFYLHYDAQPVIPSQWSQTDPWSPVIKRRGDKGNWLEVDKSALFRPDFDPELRVFARAAADDKGPIAMFLASMDLLRACALTPAVNVKILIDSEEEAGSAGIPLAVEANHDDLAADALVVFDAAEHPSGRPTLLFGNRGVLAMTLTVFGPKMPLHSGHYGNYAPNPALRLARLLAGMKDEDGRVTIPGFYQGTHLGADDRRVMEAVPDDERALKTRLGIGDTDKVGDNYQEALQYPSLNIRGLESGGVGDKAATIIPSQAVAELDIRTTVEAPAPRLAALVRTYVEGQGYFLVDHAPTDQERAQHGKIAQLTIGSASEGARQEMDSPVGRWAARALQDASDQAPVRLRQMGGTVPTAEIVGPLKLPFVLVPTVNADDNQHTYDENLRMGQFLSGMRSMLGLLLTDYDK